MTHCTHRSGPALAWLVLWAALVAMPTAAVADHDGHRRGPEHGRQRDGRGEVVRVERSHRSDHARRDDRRVERLDRRSRSALRRPTPRVRHRHHHRAARFGCRPCHRRFDTRRAFDRHLHRHHHVAPWRIPRRVFGSAFGWVFPG